MIEFNPSEHNIPDINSHLEENPTELQAVLDAEKAGKNRPTLVADLEERLKAVPQPVDPPAVEVAPSPAPTVNTANIHGADYEITPDRGYRKKK